MDLDTLFLSTSPKNRWHSTPTGCLEKRSKIDLNETIKFCRHASYFFS
uniref:Uncharacterized protein n=1 Tax=Triticum urartu TaxID=4572 RepID=A0A8R7PR55_TRIUA